MRSVGWTRGAWFAGALVALGLLAQPAAALPVQYLQQSSSPTGFSPTGFPMPVDVEIPVEGDVRGVFTGATADAYGLDIGFCLIPNESPAGGCQSAQPAGSSGFTLIVDFTLASVPDDVQEQPALIFLSALPPTPTYALEDVSVIVDPDPITGFTFTPFTTASFAAGPATTYYYLGFFLSQGDSATFRMEIDGDHSGAGQPLQLGANAWVVPEPGTAVLVGSGLLALGLRRRR